MIKHLTLIGFLYGAGIFWAAPLFTTARDPFDSIYPVLAQLPAFLFMGLLLREFRRAPVIGLLAGEATFPILKGANLWPLSIIMTAVYMIPGLVAYFLLAKTLAKSRQKAIPHIQARE